MGLLERSEGDDCPVRHLGLYWNSHRETGSCSAYSQILPSFFPSKIWHVKTSDLRIRDLNMGAGKYITWLSGENKNTLVAAFADFHGVHCFYHGQCLYTNGLSTSSQNPSVFTNWVSELVPVNTGATLCPRLEDRHGVWFHLLTHASFYLFTKLTLMKCHVTEMWAKKINLILWAW